MPMRISGTDSASRRLRRIADRAANPEPALRSLPDTFEDHVSRTFESKGGAIGRLWKPLSVPYERRKIARSTRRPLVLTGGLRDSFKGGVWHIETIGRNRLVWGSKHPLAHLHQRGSQQGRVPARPMVEVTPELRRTVRDEMKGWIVKG